MAKKTTAADDGGGRFRFLEWLPWEKLTIWALFLLLVYSLRSFFFIVFMTFILAYSMRGLVDWLAKLISPDEEKAWLHRLLTVGCFLGLIGGGVRSRELFRAAACRPGRDGHTQGGGACQQSGGKAERGPEGHPGSLPGR